MKEHYITLSDVLKSISQAELDALPTSCGFGEPEIVHTYTRAQAIEDGVLIDVSNTATDLGIVFPVAITSSCWIDAVSLPHGADWDTEQMRLNVLLERTMAELNKAGNNDTSFILFVLDGPCVERQVELRATFAPGDDLRPVITVMLANED